MIEAAPTFAVQLASAADPAELAAWLDGAAPGAWAVYASGADLPRAAAGVLLVGRWVTAGVATTSSRRDPADARRMQFLVTKRDTGGSTAALLENQKGGAQVPPGAAAPARAFPPVGPGRAHTSRAHHSYQTAGRNAARLLELLRDAAAAGAPCPSYAEVRDRLGLAKGERGKQAARAVFRRLEREKRVSTDQRGPRGLRVVTILAKGRAQGLQSGETR